MQIIIENKEIKKEVKKAIKEFKPSNITLFFNFSKDEKGNFVAGILKIQLSKNYYNNLVFNTLEFIISVKGNYNIKKIIIEEQSETSVLFQMITEHTYFLNAYAKNVKNLKIGDNGCDYWIDTIKVENEKENKEIKHNQISFDNVQMIYTDL